MDFLNGGVSHPLPTQFDQYRQSPQLSPDSTASDILLNTTAKSLEHANAVVAAASHIADRESQSVTALCDELGPLLDGSIEYLSEVLHLLEKMQHPDIASRMFSKLEDLAEKEAAASQQQQQLPTGQLQTIALNPSGPGPIRSLSHDPFAAAKDEPYDPSGGSTLQKAFEGFGNDFTTESQHPLPTGSTEAYSFETPPPTESKPDAGGFDLQLGGNQLESTYMGVTRDLARDQRLVDMSYAIMNEQIDTDPAAMAVLMPMPPSVSWNMMTGHWECHMRGHQEFDLGVYGGFFNAYNAVIAEIEPLYTDVTEMNDEEIFYECKTQKRTLIHNASLLMKYISAPISDSPITQGLAFNLEAAAWTVLVENEDREREVEAYFNVKLWGDILKGLLAAQVFRAYRSMG